MSEPTVTIQYTRGYVPGTIGRVAELHGAYYHANWDFGLYFEAKVATELAAFLTRYDPCADGFWSATLDGRIEGSVTIDAHQADTAGAHLRWFIVSDAVRGQGVGRQLIEQAVEWCHERHYRSIYLWTFEGLLAARHLYEQAGFTLVEEHTGDQWGAAVTEQRFELRLF